LLVALVLDGAQRIDGGLWQAIVFLNILDPIVHFLFMFTFAFFINMYFYSPPHAELRAISTIFHGLPVIHRGHGCHFLGILFIPHIDRSSVLFPYSHFAVRSIFSSGSTTGAPRNGSRLVISGVLLRVAQGFHFLITVISRKELYIT
jgi:hypothetical protein